MNKKKCNNRKVYKEAFSKLHTSNEFRMEDLKMNKKISGMRLGKKLVATVAVLVLVLGMTCVANAATGGKVWDNVKIIINGESVDGSEYMDKNGDVSIDLDEGDSAEVKSGGSETTVDSNCNSTVKIDEEGNEEVVIK